MDQWLGKSWSKHRKEDFEMVLIGDRASLTGPFLSNILGEYREFECGGRTCCVRSPRCFDVDGVRVTAHLVPALSDAVGYKDEEYVKKIQAVLVSAHLVIYCVDMSDTRLRGSVLRTFQELKTDWSRIIIVLTFADALPALIRHRNNPNFPKGHHFDARLAEWKMELKAMLRIVGVQQEVVARINVYPCVHEPKDVLPNGEPWLAPLSLAIMEVLTPKKREGLFVQECATALPSVTDAARQSATQTVTTAAETSMRLGVGEVTEVQSNGKNDFKIFAASSLLTEDQSKSIREALSKLRKDCPILGVLVIGRTGAGKSTLINNLLGKEVVSVGHTLKTETPMVNPHEYLVEGVPIVVYDTPGLGDIKGKEDEEKHLDIMKALLARRKIHLVVYCFQMNKTIVKSSHIGPLCKYHQIGVDWEKSVIALTFADALYVSKSEQELPHFRMSSYFEDKLAFWKAKLKQELIEVVGVNSDVIAQLKICPTTPVPKDQLPNGNPWYVPFWLHIVEILSPAATLRFLDIHKKNICDEETPPLSKRAKVEVSLVKEDRNQFAVTVVATIEAAVMDNSDNIGALVATALESGVGAFRKLL